MKKIILFFLFAVTAFGQVTYNFSQFKNVFYNKTYEKTHGTYALFDTSSLKFYWTTSGKPEMKFFGPTGNTLFYVDSTGAIGTGTFPTYLLKLNFGDSLVNYDGYGVTITDNTDIKVDTSAIPTDYDMGLRLLKTAFGDSLVNYDGYGVTITDNADMKVDTSAIPTDYDMGLRLLKTAFGDSLVNYEGWGVDIIDNDNLHVDSAQVASVYADGLKLLKTAFDDSLNNAHTVTGAWKFSGAVGTVPNGAIGIGSLSGEPWLRFVASDGDTMSIDVNATGTFFRSKNSIQFFKASANLVWSGAELYPGANDAWSLGAIAVKWKKYLGTDSILVGGKAQDATLWWGQSRQLTAADSCGLLTMASGNPVISMYATDGDNYTQSINTSDQAVFTGASGGYEYDAPIDIRTSGIADTLFYVTNDKNATKDSTLTLMNDGSLHLGTVNTTYKFNVTNSVGSAYSLFKGTVYASNYVWAESDGGSSGHSLVDWGYGLNGAVPTRSWYAGLKSTETFYIGTRDDNWGAIGDGDLIAIETDGDMGIGNLVPLSNSLTLGNKTNQKDFLVTRENVAAGTDSSLYATITSGEPVLRWNQSDGDQWQISGTTADQATFYNASGGYLFDALLRTRDTDSDTLAMNPKGFSATNTNLAGTIAWQLKDGATNLASIDTNGVLIYNFIHLVASADSVAYTPSVTKNVYTKLVPGMTAHENDGFTLAGDTVKVLTAGDYKIDISVRMSGANANDVWRIKVYKNNLAIPSSVGRFIIRTTSAGQADTRAFFWYLESLAVNDIISFKITNFTASRNPTFEDFKIYIEKKPE